VYLSSYFRDWKSKQHGTSSGEEPRITSPHDGWHHNVREERSHCQTENQRGRGMAKLDLLCQSSHKNQLTSPTRTTLVPSKGGTLNDP
jgi:hypothetical protein